MQGTIWAVGCIATAVVKGDERDPGENRCVSTHVSTAMCWYLLHEKLVLICNTKMQTVGELIADIQCKFLSHMSSESD